MKKIPTRIEIAGQEINILHIPNMVSLADRFGDWDAKVNTIRVQAIGHGIPADVCFQAFFHEQVHACLDLTGHHDLSSDESFTERLAQVLYQAEKSRSYSPK